jgi:hypothetical protein
MTKGYLGIQRFQELHTYLEALVDAQDNIVKQGGVQVLGEGVPGRKGLRQRVLPLDPFAARRYGLAAQPLGKVCRGITGLLCLSPFRLAKKPELGPIINWKRKVGTVTEKIGVENFRFEMTSVISVSNKFANSGF